MLDVRGVGEGYVGDLGGCGGIDYGEVLIGCWGCVLTSNVVVDCDD